MRSSTFSSDRVPGGRIFASVSLGLVLALLILVGLELTWRALGHRPSVTDTPDTWSYYRLALDKVQPKDKAIALLGSSRMELGFDLATAHARFPDRPVMQLAIDGRWPMAVLEDLAHSDFSGLAIVELTPQALLDPFWDDQKSYVTHFHRVYEPSPDHRIATHVRLWVQSRVVLLQSALHVKRIAKALVTTHRLPGPYYLTTLANRQRLADYSLTDGPAQKADRIGMLAADIDTWPIDDAMWMRNMARTRSLVERIESRGGKVVFVAFPVAPEMLAVLERRMPRSTYWSSISAATGAPALWLSDDPAIARFDIPDGSHLDARDSPAFTGRLLDRLAGEGLL